MTKIIKILIIAMFLVFFSGIVSAVNPSCDVSITGTGVNVQFKIPAQGNYPIIPELEAGNNYYLTIKNCNLGNAQIVSGEIITDAGGFYERTTGLKDLTYGRSVSANFPTISYFTKEDLRVYYNDFSITGPYIASVPIKIKDTKVPTIQNDVTSVNCDADGYVNLDCSANDASELKYKWNFDSDFQSSCWRPNQKYNLGKDYTATVVVKDAGDNTATKNIQVKCGGASTIKSKFVASKGSNTQTSSNTPSMSFFQINKGDKVNFEITSDARNYDSYEWDFDISYSANAPTQIISRDSTARISTEYTYNSVGVYYALLKAIKGTDVVLSWVIISVSDPNFDCTLASESACNSNGCYWCGAGKGNCKSFSSECSGGSPPTENAEKITMCQTSTQCGDEKVCVQGQCKSEDITGWTCVESDGLPKICENDVCYDNPVYNNPYIVSSLIASSSTSSLGKSAFRMVPKNAKDECVDEHTVKEVSCNWKGEDTSELKKCKEGEICKDGKCWVTELVNENIKPFVDKYGENRIQPILESLIEAGVTNVNDIVRILEISENKQGNILYSDLPDVIDTLSKYQDIKGNAVVDFFNEIVKDKPFMQRAYGNLPYTLKVFSEHNIKGKDTIDLLKKLQSVIPANDFDHVNTYILVQLLNTGVTKPNDIVKFFTEIKKIEDKNKYNLFKSDNKHLLELLRMGITDTTQIASFVETFTDNENSVVLWKSHWESLFPNLNNIPDEIKNSDYFVNLDKKMSANFDSETISKMYAFVFPVLFNTGITEPDRIITLLKKTEEIGGGINSLGNQGRTTKFYDLALPSLINSEITDQEIIKLINKVKEDSVIKDMPDRFYNVVPDAIKEVKAKGKEVSAENIFSESLFLLSEVGRYPEEYEIRRQLYFRNQDFLDIYDYLKNYKDPSNIVRVFSREEKYSITMATYRFREINPSFTIKDAIDYVIRNRDEFEKKIILGPNTNLIMFTHEEEMFFNGAMINFAKDRGVVNTGPSDLKGAPKRGIILDLISKSKRETVIWFSGHGAKNRIALAAGQSETLVNGKLTPTSRSIDFSELGDVLIKRGKLKEVTVIIDACFSYDYAENLINYLKEKKVTELPTIITETNKGSYGYGDVFLSSLINVQEPGPLLGRHIYDAEKYSWEKQDSAVFFSVGESIVEIASNTIPEDCCGGMCSTKTTASLSKPTLMGRIKEKIVDFFS